MNNKYTDITYIKSDNLLHDTQIIIETAQKYAYHAINIALVQRNWLLGKRIAEEKLQGKGRAEYVAEIIQKLSSELTRIYGEGFNKTNLYMFTEFYKSFPEIFHSVSGKLDTLRLKSFSLLTWTHYRTLLQVKDPEARNWYAQAALAVYIIHSLSSTTEGSHAREAAEQTWSVRTLQRNNSSQYYFRLLKSHMYIRMYDELKRTEGDNPTLGIVLCSNTDEDIARYSILNGNEQLFASKYKTYLPSEEELRAEIETQKRLFYLQQNLNSWNN